MKTIFKLLIASVFFASCGEADTAVYDGTSDSQTLLSFSNAVYTLPVLVNATGELEVTLNSSTVSNVDRVFNISVISEESSADPATYSVPSTVTIPANSNKGVLVVHGMDVGLEDPKVLTISFATNADGQVFDANKAIINVTQVCPVDRDSLLGTYAAVETPGPYNYTVIAEAGDAPNELVLRNIWDVDPNSRTSVFVSEDPNNTVITFPPYLDNFLYVNATYGNAYVDVRDAALDPSSVDACTNVITLNFRVTVAAGSFDASKVVLTKQ
ncbi:hypothetical protein [Flavobacterium sp.]|uniref:hypothetical protein n=1 Tax=Flavobacterium sp. TaxID=239 RepID=UPI00262D543E|nr:hypothetical protein [Flavobacterium sp.]